MLAIAISACKGTVLQHASSEQGASAEPGGETRGAPPIVASADDAWWYLDLIAPAFARRVLGEAELADVVAREGQAIAPIVERWLAEPGLPEAARTLVQTRLSVSGAKDGIDFELAGNLAAHLVKQQLPLSGLLTADHCVDAAGASIPCDTGAPYAAGVLATRGFLKSRSSRFNLTRASAMLGFFACRHYPMEDELQPKTPKEALLPMFAAMTAEEQTDDRAKGGFGNGSACYGCHGQFGPHAQLFVRFDSNGMYRPEATGLQDPAGELGRSTGGLMASHLRHPEEAMSERSQIFGKPVENLRDAARVLAEEKTFVPCQVRNLLQFAFGLGASDPIDPELLAEIADRAKAGGRDPTFQDLVRETFTDGRVVASAIANRRTE